MKIKKALMELKENSQPYIQFWEKWIKSDACFLTENEIKTIEKYVFKNWNFSGCVLLSFKMEKQLNLIEKLNEKLKVEYYKYKEWVILTFLYSIIRMAESNGKREFMNLPISELEVINEVKIELRKLNINTLYQFFVAYNPDDLYEPEVYRSITEINKHLSSEKRQNKF